jgi:hypothetical protein
MYYPEIFLKENDGEEGGESRKLLVRIACVLPDIPSEHLPNTRPECYR